MQLRHAGNPVRAPAAAVLVALTWADACGPAHAQAAADAPADDWIVRCESLRNQRVTCRLPGVVRVRLVRELGRAPCREGETWGLGPRGIWVDGGCRGEFEIVTRLSAAP